MKTEARPLFDRGYPDSISVLSPTTPGLAALAKLPVNTATPFHSIIGDRGLGNGEKSSDGAVPYWSSHLPGAASEVIVPANHRTYESPEAIAEVKRILKLHVAEIRTIKELNREMTNRCAQRPDQSKRLRHVESLPACTLRAASLLRGAMRIAAFHLRKRAHAAGQVQDH
jgi:hypothetical protein